MSPLARFVIDTRNGYEHRLACARAVPLGERARLFVGIAERGAVRYYQRHGFMRLFTAAELLTAAAELCAHYETMT